MDDDKATLSPETLAILKAFALDSGVALSNDDDDDDVIDSVQKHFDLEDKNETFNIHHTSTDGTIDIQFNVKGLKRELGQTLSSTGLTIWRAAEHLSQFIVNHPEYFQGKSCCELGAGLGLVSILLGKCGIAESILSTDGDDDTMDLLRSNVIDNFDSDMIVQTEKLFWGDHSDFLQKYSNKFDVLLGADIIYEEDQIAPLFSSVSTLLSPNGQFILAFARRNVPVDRVFLEAERIGLSPPLNLDPGLHGMEPIYLFTWKTV